MANTFVTNITHFLDENGAIAEILQSPGKELAENLTKIIACVTALPRITTATDIPLANEFA